MYLSELFPKLARVADKFSLIRSMHHDAPPIHESGLQLLNTGRVFRDGPEWPSVGAVISHLKRAAGESPAVSEVIPTTEINTGVNVSPGLGCGFLGFKAHVSSEGPRPLARFVRYGDTQFGKNLGWACREVRLGTPFVTVNMFPTVFDAPSWDCHADRGSLATTLDDYRDTVAPSFDTAFSTLLTILDERGLLDTTLVVATGEFGRTPRLNANGGRDHWAGCWTALVAGGGVRGGRVIGASDRFGAEPADRPVSPQELVATIFQALGVPPETTIPGPEGEAVMVYPGRPVAELF
jgi:hypothetical protein